LNVEKPAALPAFSLLKMPRLGNPLFLEQRRLHGADMFAKAVLFGEKLPPIGSPEGKKSRIWGKRKLARDR
jgi:hypothetical protein